MNEQTMDRVARTLATRKPRRVVLQAVAAAVGSGLLVHLTRGKTDARLSRCCRRAKLQFKATCLASGATCTQVTDFRCLKTGPGTCATSGGVCTTKDGDRC